MAKVWFAFLAAAMALPAFASPADDCQEEAMAAARAKYMRLTHTDVATMSKLPIDYEQQTIPTVTYTVTIAGHSVNEMRFEVLLGSKCETKRVEQIKDNAVSE